MARTPSDRESVVGEEAHIAARSPGGPRYVECDPTEVDDYENLILLCREDHKVVDDQPNHFTSEKLRRIKSAHEEWVADTLAIARLRGESRLDLSELRVTSSNGETDSCAVLDLMIRNIGEQPAVIHRAEIRIRDAIDLSVYNVLGFRPYEELWVRGPLETSHRYHLELPHPHAARDTRHELEINQFIRSADADRFHIRLGTPLRQDPLVYLLDLDLFYDRHGLLSAPALAVAHPSATSLPTYEEVRDDLNAFWPAVGKVRDAIDREMIALGRRQPDWDNNPPSARADLPSNLRCLEGDPFGLTPGAYMVNENFWDPKGSFARQCRQVRAFYEHVARVIGEARVSHTSLPEILKQARIVLSQLPPCEEENC